MLGSSAGPSATTFPDHLLAPSTTTPYLRPFSLLEGSTQASVDEVDTPAATAHVPHHLPIDYVSHPSIISTASKSSLHTSTAHSLLVDSFLLQQHGVETACRWSGTFPAQQTYIMLSAAFPGIDCNIIRALIQGIAGAGGFPITRVPGQGMLVASPTTVTSTSPLHFSAPPDSDDVEIMDLIIDLQDQSPIATPATQRQRRRNPR